jgi:hypothetical protein
MLERLSAPDGVLALRASGQISEADVATAIVWLDQDLATANPLHLFVVADDLTGLDPSGLVHAWMYGAHLLTHLRRFGRVAIVSEQRWVRTLARLESAILPGISYRVFDQPDHAMAFAWVCGPE